MQGLPLHLQIDTYDDPRDATPVFHRGYAQVKVFCDKVINHNQLFIQSPLLHYEAGSSGIRIPAMLTLIWGAPSFLSDIDPIQLFNKWTSIVHFPISIRATRFTHKIMEKFCTLFIDSKRISNAFIRFFKNYYLYPFPNSFIKESNKMHFSGIFSRYDRVRITAHFHTNRQVTRDIFIPEITYSTLFIYLFFTQVKVNRM